MVFDTEISPRGNIGKSYISLEDAMRQRDEMDYNFCTDCRECSKCYGCTNCVDCDRCVNCTDCYRCVLCTECENCSRCMECKLCHRCINQKDGLSQREAGWVSKVDALETWIPEGAEGAGSNLVSDEEYDEGY
jgi:hypothetical protein